MKDSEMEKSSMAFLQPQSFFCGKNVSNVFLAVLFRGLLMNFGVMILLDAKPYIKIINDARQFMNFAVQLTRAREIFLLGHLLGFLDDHSFHPVNPIGDGCANFFPLHQNVRTFRM
jgi:hypothetical protein